MLGWFFGRRRGLDLGHVQGRADGLSDAVALLRRELADRPDADVVPLRRPGWIVAHKVVS